MTTALHGVKDEQVAEAVRAFVKLMRAQRTIVARVETRLAEACLTLTQLGVLEALLHKGPLTQRELGRKLLTSPGNMTDVIDKLTARDLVRRERDTGDHRRVHVFLTECGRTLIETIFPAHAVDIARAMSSLDTAEIRQLAALLRKLGTAPLADDDDSNHLGV